MIMVSIKVLFTLVAVCFINLDSRVDATKVDCIPFGRVTEHECIERGCIWSPINGETQNQTENRLPFDRKQAEELIPGGLKPKVRIGQPWCYFSDDHQNFKVVNSSDPKKIKLKYNAQSNADIKHVTVKIDTYGYDGTILRIRIFNAEKRRFEPEVPQLNLHKSETSKFSHKVDSNGHLVVKRDSNQEILFSTHLGKLVFTHKYIQLDSNLSSDYLFGLGEHFDSYVKLANTYKVYSFYNTDKPPVDGGQRSYGSFPFYMNTGYLDENIVHGVYLHSSNGLDIVVQADRSISFRTTGGILDFFIFSGPKPIQVIKQFQGLIGRPSIPPRWALGYHLSRSNYSTLDNMKNVLQRTKDSGLPFEAIWTDVEVMDKRRVFTLNHEKFAGLSGFVDNLHEQKMHYVTLIHPAISIDSYRSYSSGQKMDIWIKNATNKNLVGKLWLDGEEVVYPDFSNDKSVDYWRTLIKDFHDELKFDGVWISMNELSNSQYGSVFGCSPDNPAEHLPYKPGGFDLQDKSLCLSAKHKVGLEHDAHNLHSIYEAIATKEALKTTIPGKRPLIISRATSPGQGRYTGHWSGNILSNWDYLRWSIPAMIEHSMYGFALVGSDICGYQGDTNEELCARWSTLGAFYPLARNHNDERSIDQDPVALGPTVLEATKNALNKRYNLLPYLYTLMYRAHKFGEPVIRSLQMQYSVLYNDVLKVEDQFMWGDGIMISPIVDQNSTTKRTYLPSGRWFESSIVPDSEFYKRPRSIYTQDSWFVASDVSLVDLKFFYRGGNIIPTYPDVKPTIDELVKQPIGLDVALNLGFESFGELYLDDGESIDAKYTLIKMKYTDAKLTIWMDKAGYVPAVKFGKVKIFGSYSFYDTVRVAGAKIPFEIVGASITFDLKGREVRMNKKIFVEIYNEQEGENS